MVWCGMVWNGMVWWLGNLIYREVAGGKESAAVLSSRHWLQKAPPPPRSFEERLMDARWQIDFDRRRDADISGIE